jgi:phage tail sheath protein FI
MPVSLTSPGVYTQEVPSGLTTIRAASTSTALFIGMTYRGQLNVPKRCLGFRDYERIFGSDRSTGEMTDQVRQFFLNGGSEAWVMRIANGTASASATLMNDDPVAPVAVLTLTARETGSVGDLLRVEIDYDTAEPENSFNLRITERSTSPAGLPIYTPREEHKNLTMDPSSSRYAVVWINDKSDVLSAALESGTAPAPIQGYSLGGLLLAPDPAIAGDINGRIPGAIGDSGHFQISVDGGPTTTVGLVKGGIPDLAAITKAINDALTPLGSARVDALALDVPSAAPVNSLLLIRSRLPGGTVKITRAISNDIAGLLQLGTANGGLEVGGFANRRPAPTGLFTSLGDRDLDAALANKLAPLTTFLLEDLNNVDTITIADTAGGGSVPPLVAVPTPIAGPGPDRGLRSALQVLEQIGDGINARVFPLKWRAKRAGHRLVLLPQAGSDDSDVGATLTSTGAYNLGAGATGLFEQQASVLRYRLGATPFGYTSASSPSSAGSIPIARDYETAYDIVRKEIEVFNLLVLPRAAGQTDLERDGLWPAASAFCSDRLAFLLVDPHDTWNDYNDAWKGADDIRQLGLVNDHSGLFWPRLKITDSVSRLERAIDPSGSLAGLAARIDSSVGVWKAFAGLEANFRGVRGLEYRMSDAENGVINPKAVNALRIFSSGTVCWGARTLDGFDDSGNSDYRYIPVRRLALHIRGSLLRGLGFAVFRPNGEALWAEIRRAAKGFLHNLYRQGAFAGATARDSYQVKCDAETTTETDRRLGIVNVLVMFAPLFPAEFVVITLQQMTQEAQT